MPRPIKAQPITAHGKILHKSLQNDLPNSPGWLQNIIYALIVRIRRINESDGRQIQGVIRLMAAAESHCENFHNNEKLVKQCSRIMQELCDGIAFAKNSRSNAAHLGSALRYQRDLIVDYLSGHPFPFNARNSDRPIKWFAGHLPVVHTKLILFPCSCDYRMEKDIDQAKLAQCDSKVILVRTMLAELHGLASIETARDLLKPSSSK